MEHNLFPLEFQLPDGIDALQTAQKCYKEDTFPEDGLYHYLLQPGEEHDDQRKGATDRI